MTSYYRSYRAEFFSREEVASLSYAARILLLGLAVEADRAGRFKWRTVQFRIRYFPLDDINIDEVAAELVKQGLVVRYGEGLAYLPGFAETQWFNVKEPESKLPAPPGSSADVNARLPSGMPPPRVSDACNTRDRLGPNESPADGMTDRDANPSSHLTDDDVNGTSRSVVVHLSGTKEKKRREKEISGDEADSADIHEQATALLDYLNQAAGKHFRPVPSNLKLIEARLREGATAEECRQVIDAKVAGWDGDPKMADYLRPETLFNASKFHQYLGNIRQEPDPEASWC